MKKATFLLVLNILIIWCLNIYGQNQQLDSLWNYYNQAKHDTTRIKLLNEEIGYFYESFNSDSAIFFYNKAIELADKNFKLQSQKNQQFLLLKANSLRYIGIVHRNQGNYDKAIEFYLKSLKIYEEINDKKGMSSCYNSLGIIQSDQVNYEKALEYLFKALKINEELKDIIGMSKCYNNLGAIFKLQNNYDKATEFYAKALEINEKLGKKEFIPGNYNNLGMIQYDIGNYDKAMEYYLISLKKHEEINDKSGIIASNVNICLLFSILADSATLSESQRLRYLNRAIEFGTRAYELALEIKSISRENEAADCLMRAYKKLGNFKKSMEYAEIFISTKDSMFSEEKTKSLAEMGAKYESEKRELTILKLEKEKLLQNETLARKEAESKKQRILIFSFLAGFLIILVFSIFLYRLFLQKKKANVIIARKNQSLEIAYSEINTQKEEITSQRDEIEAHRDKLHEQNHILFEQKKEITDSINYAKRIQNAVLPETDILQMILGEHFLLFKPKDIVSGDFYWATIINNWQILTVADCTGHGVPGAFMSMLGVSFINEIVRKEEVSQANQVLNHLRLRIINSMKQKGISGEQKDGMDISLCVINLENQYLQFAGANNPLWIVRNNDNKKMPPFEKGASLEELKPDKMPIAIYERMDDFTNHERQLNEGDIIYLMSDGYEDQFGGPKHKKFLSKNLKQLLIDNCQLQMEGQKQILEKTLNEWIGNGEQIDDITILGIKI